MHCRQSRTLAPSHRPCGGGWASSVTRVVSIASAAKPLPPPTSRLSRGEASGNTWEGGQRALWLCPADRTVWEPCPVLSSAHATHLRPFASSVVGHVCHSTHVEVRGPLWELVLFHVRINCPVVPSEPSSWPSMYRGPIVCQMLLPWPAETALPSCCPCGLRTRVTHPGCDE